MGSDTVGAALRAARRDDSVKAVVFRVDSPGGSYVASDTIWREVVLTRQAGKPVVVSMGDLAASGGYFVSMAADAIVAQPGTLTGSIGVFGGKAVIGGLLEKIGVRPIGDRRPRGQRRDVLPPRAFSEDEWAAGQRLARPDLRRLREQGGRGPRPDRERAHELARGRVWTGADAARAGWSTSRRPGGRPGRDGPQARPDCPPTRRCAPIPG